MRESSRSLKAEGESADAGKEVEDTGAYPFAPSNIGRFILFLRRSGANETDFAQVRIDIAHHADRCGSRFPLGQVLDFAQRGMTRLGFGGVVDAIKYGSGGVPAQEFAHLVRRQFLQPVRNRLSTRIMEMEVLDAEFLLEPRVLGADAFVVKRENSIIAGLVRSSV